MAYIGNQNYQAYVTLASQTFSVTSTTIYSLNYTVTNANNIALYINNVAQQPTTAYTASGNTLTLTTTTLTTDTMYAVYLGQGIQTVQPGTSSVGTSQITTGAVGLSQLSATGTPNSTTFLRGDNTWNSPLAGSGPAFSAYLAPNQSVTSTVLTKITLNTKTFDTNTNFDATTNYRFTPTIAGYYQINAATQSQATSMSAMILSIYRNGTAYKSQTSALGGTPAFVSMSISDVIYMNGSTDYIELYGQVNGTSPLLSGGSTYTYMSGVLVRSA